MKKYKVAYWYTLYGSSVVEARSPQEAEAKFKRQLDIEGIHKLQNNFSDREFGTQDAEEIQS